MGTMTAAQRAWMAAIGPAGPESEHLIGRIKAEIEAAVREERERSAKIAEGHKAGWGRSDSRCGKRIAKAIRES